MGLVFCPPGTHVILVEYRGGLEEDACDPSDPAARTAQDGAGGKTMVECSFPQDHEFWSHIRHLRVVWYQAHSRSEIHDPGSKNARKTRNVKQRDRDNHVIVDVQRMGNLVQGAIDAMEPHAGSQ